MRVIDFLSMPAVEDDDLIIIRDSKRLLARGKWYQDNILKYCEASVKYYSYASDYMNLNGISRHIIVLEEI